MAPHTHTLTDAASGHQHHLTLSVPGGPHPATGWPLLCLLDGDWTWPLLQHSSLLDRVVVLALGYGGDKALTTRCRAYDYTPPDMQGRRWPDPRVPAWQGGGAPAFTLFLQEQVLPWLQGQAALNPAALSLFGHSYAGLFVLYALAGQALPFSRLIAASPSLWWHDGIIHHYLDGLAALPAPRRLDIIAGQAEAWHPQPAQATPGIPRTGGIPTLPAMQTLHDRLARVAGLSVRLHPLPQAGHAAVLDAATRLALTLSAQPVPSGDWHK